jgi:hypothetical protein
MMIVIDTNTTALAFDQLAQLDGVEYLLDFEWEDRESCWYMNIFDQDQNPLAYGIKLVINTPLLRRFRDPRLPKGLLFCGDLSESETDIAAPGDLGNRVPLVYLTADDPSIPT